MNAGETMLTGSAAAAFHHDHDGNLWKTEWRVLVKRANDRVPVAGPFGRREDADAARREIIADEPTAHVVRYETEPGMFELPELGRAAANV